MLKQKQAAAQQQQQKQTLPMLEMMSLLNNAKSNLAEQDKLSSLMMSSMAAAAMQAAAASTSQNTSQSTSQNGGNSNGGSNTAASDDYCCILCGYKEQSVERLKDHINLHFIGQVKRKNESEQSENGTAKTDEPAVKRIKVKEESAVEHSSANKSAPTSPQQGDEENTVPSSSTSPSSSGGQLKCNSCDIGFSHLSNYVAHKKYYCRGMPQPPVQSMSAVDVKAEPNGKESPSK